MLPPTDSPEHITILVHGTWGRGVLPLARSAAWCAEGSACRRAYSEALGSPQMHVFNWSGANTPSARLKAAAGLAGLVRELKACHPQALIHIVAHSHGGNISFYAARETDVAAAISSIACLSTPFLHVVPRELGTWLAKKLNTTVNFFAFVVVFMLVAISVAFLAPHGGWDLGPTTLGLIEIGAGLLIGGLVIWRFGPQWHRLHEWNRVYAKSFELPTSLPCEVLILRGAADEVGSALGAAQFFSTILSRLMRLLARFLPATLLGYDEGSTDSRRGDPSSRAWSRIGAFGVSLAFFAIGIEIVTWLTGWHPDWLEPLAVSIFGYTFTPAVVIAILGVLLAGSGALSLLFAAPVLLLLVILMAIALLPYGLRFALAGVSLHISAEATPPGRWVVDQLAAGAIPLQEHRGLSHGTHSDVGAMSVLREWLSSRFELKPGAAGNS